MFARSTLEERLADARMRFPIGTAVIYQPDKDHPEAVTSSVRTAPWALGNGEIMVVIEGGFGGVPVSRLIIARHPATNIGE